MHLQLLSNREPLVSVIVRTVNRPHYLRECLRSIDRQDYREVEIVLVNDGGPSVRELVAELGLRVPVSLIELEQNAGRSESGNIGMRQANGDYLCFLDDDDIFYPFHISELISVIRKERALVAYSDSLQAKQIPCPFDDRLYLTTQLELIYSEDATLIKLLERNFIPILCVLFSRECLEDGASFDVMLDVLEDWDFWIQLAAFVENRGQRFVHLSQITSEYRLRIDGTNTVGQLEHRWTWSRKYVEDKHRALLDAQTLGIKQEQRL